MLTAADRNSLTKNRVDLVKQMVANDEFFSHLIADYSLTEAMVEEINSKPVSAIKNGKLLDLLARRPRTAFVTFIRALVETDQEHISEKVSLELTRRFVAERNVRRGQPCQPDTLYNETSAVVTSKTITHTLPSELIPPKCMDAQQVTSPGFTAPVKMFAQVSRDDDLTSLPSSSVSPSEVGMELDPNQDEDGEITNILAELTIDIDTTKFVQELGQIDSQLKLDGSVTENKGFAIIVCNKTLNKTELPLARQALAIEDFFVKLNFTVEMLQSVSFEQLESRLKRFENNMETCKAFIMYFVGFGKADDTVFMKDGQMFSLYNKIIPLFSAEQRPSLSKKLKLFIFHLAEPDIESPKRDMVDAKLENSSWADMIIFRNVLTVTQEMIGNNNMNTFMLFFHALAKLMWRSRGIQLDVVELLKKVDVILQTLPKAQKLNVKRQLILTPPSPGKTFCLSL